ncbi:MAG: K(+)-transporting ATPase subunit C [Hungatella sp.]
MKTFLKMLKNALILSGVLMVLCAIVYPLALTGAGQLLFHKQANGNLVEVNGKAVGSELVGQQFSDAGYFKGRISAVHYNTYTEADLLPDADGNPIYGGVASGGSNYGASNPDLAARVEADMSDFLAANPGVKAEDIPADLLTASGSGLDPHISPAAAKIQIPAIAAATGLTEAELEAIVAAQTEHKVLGVFGEERVNVLKSNIEIAKALGKI